MTKRICLFLTVLSLCLTSCKNEYKDLKDGLYADIETSRGNIIVELDYQKVPVMVANFVTLAEGTNQFVTKELKGKPFYDGLSFHRVISKLNGDAEDFMIQTGDPLGNGSGDAGYKCQDEITDLKHSKPGILSMANSGPNTNSSQFFITLVPTPWLDGQHTVFGCVADEQSMNVASSIVRNDNIVKVTIIRKGEAVKKFDAVKTFNDYFKAEEENQKEKAALEAKAKKEYDIKYKPVKDKKAAYLNQQKETAEKTPSGFKYVITKKTNEDKPKDGETIYADYSGYLEDGTLFDTSSPDVAKQFGVYDEQRALENGYSSLPYVMGSNKMIPGFVEGLSKMKIGEKAIFFIPFNLGYGEQGAGNVIPPNSNLIFEVELKNK